MAFLIVLCWALILLALTTGVFIWFKQYRSFINDLRKIPGPPHLPIIGCLLEILFLSPEQLFQKDRQRALKYYPIYKQNIFHVLAVNILCPEDIELVLGSSKHNKKTLLYATLHSWLGRGLLTSYGEKWQMRRKIITRAFHFSILEEFVKIFNKNATKFMEDLEKRLNEPHVDVIPFSAEYTLHTIIETSMGTKLDTSDGIKSYKEAIYDFGKIVTYRIVHPWLMDKTLFWLTPTARECKKVVNILHSFSKKVINKRKINFHLTSDNPKQKLVMLDLLLKAKEKDGIIDDDGIREEVDTFIFEGHDSTSVAISFLLFLLSQHPEVQERVRDEIIDVLGDFETIPTYIDLQKLEYTERCVKECLRLYPSVPFIAREASEDIYTTTGYKIPKGAMVHIHIFDIHNNPNLFPEPEKFDPDRFLPENVQKRHPFAYIPFSAGPRNCIGQKFAMLVIKTALCAILRKFILEPAEDVSTIVFVTDLILRCKNQIKVKFRRRNN